MRFRFNQTIALALSAALAGATFLAPWVLVAALGAWSSLPTFKVEPVLRRAPVALMEPVTAAAPSPVPDPPMASPADEAVVPEEPRSEQAGSDKVGPEVPRPRLVRGAARAGVGLRGLAARRGKRRGPRRNRCTEVHPSVRKATDGVVEVDRAYVKRVTRNIKSFMTLGYSRPFDEDGVKGWYISGFGCTSPVHQAGFRRRDVLLRVNGKKTRTWAGVFLLYQKLKRKEAFEVEVLRRGQPVRLNFRVVEDWPASEAQGTGG